MRKGEIFLTHEKATQKSPYMKIVTEPKRNSYEPDKMDIIDFCQVED